MKKGLTLTVRRVLEVKDGDDFYKKMDQQVQSLEAAGWVVDTDANDDGDDDWDGDDEDDEDGP
jgi:hypothetical protein